MIKNETRESAHLRSRVKDLSAVPNLVNFTGLFAAITPIARMKRNADNLYDPILIRDTDSLIANFGDPRIDPEKYIDLYSIMQVVANGTSCYVAKVPSGDSGVYTWETEPETLASAITLTPSGNVWESGLVNDKYDVLKVHYQTSIDDDDPETDPVVSSGDLDKSLYTIEVSSIEDKFKYTLKFNNGATIPTGLSSLSITDVAKANLSMVAYSSMPETLTVRVTLTQTKPLTLKAFYLIVDVFNIVNGNSNKLSSAKIKLEAATTNKSLVNTLNSVLGTYLTFELSDASTADAAEANDQRDSSIVMAILDAHVPHADNDRTKPRTNIVPVGNKYEVNLNFVSETVAPNFHVSLDDYISTLQQFKAKKYTGCIMSDLTAPMNFTYTPTGETSSVTVFGAPSFEDRRTLHYHIKDIARERKDCNVILSVPHKENCTKLTYYTWDDICDWVSSTGGFTELWEYGQGATTDYATQSFYLEMYASWLKMQCARIVNGNAGSVKVEVAPSNVVINNVLTSYRERGVQYPVAGDQGGVLPESCEVIMNPATKLLRDQLVQCRINPIYDTGTRGVQIYGNETLNAGYTDLNAAHIARTLVYIRGRIDEYTETLKFSLNNSLLWDKWKTYVTQYILEPLISVNALSEYRIAMGEDTTSPEERANRQVNGLVQLIFYQSAEIFDLTYTVYSSSTTIDEAMANT